MRATFRIGRGMRTGEVVKSNPGTVWVRIYNRVLWEGLLEGSTRVSRVIKRHRRKHSVKEMY